MLTQPIIIIFFFFFFFNFNFFQNVIAEFASTESESEEEGVFGSFFGGASDPAFGLWDGVWDSTKQLGKRVSIAVGLADESIDTDEFEE